MPWCTRRRSAARRSRMSSLPIARSRAACSSAAAASARITGPRVRQVSSTRIRTSDCRGLCSSATSTSTRSALGSSFASRPSFSRTLARKRSSTSVLRDLTTMSTRRISSARVTTLLPAVLLTVDPSPVASTVHCPRPRRCVAATVAAPTTAAPAARSARADSASVAPVVIRSSARITVAPAMAARAPGADDERLGEVRRPRRPPSARPSPRRPDRAAAPAAPAPPRPVRRTIAAARRVSAEHDVVTARPHRPTGRRHRHHSQPRISGAAQYAAPPAQAAPIEAASGTASDRAVARPRRRSL